MTPTDLETPPLTIGSAVPARSGRPARRSFPSLVLGLAFGAACAPELLTDSSPQSIIGGEMAEPGEHPAAGFLWMLSDSGLVSGCSASLIAPDVVLTAAHCVEDLGPITVTLAFTNAVTAIDAFTRFSPPFELRPETRVGRDFVAHPDFGFSSAIGGGLARVNDIALVFLDAAFTDVLPARLPPGPEFMDLETPVTIVGYGLREPNQQIGIREAKQFTAETRITELGPWEMRVGRTSPDAPFIPQKCHGDSGGPSFVSVPGEAPYVVGVTSRAYDPGDNCASGGVDTRVEAYLSWIEAEMEAACLEGRRPGAPEEACGTSESPDAGFVEDLGSVDASADDAGVSDLGDQDGGVLPFRPVDGQGEGCSAGLRADGGLSGLIIGLGLVFARRRARRVG